MKLKLALVLALGMFLMAVSAPTPNIGGGDIISNIMCKVCTRVCDGVADKCYAQVKEDGKLYGVCQKLDDGCHAKCPCE